jgi:ABC-2 type transport system permease protein
MRWRQLRAVMLKEVRQAIRDRRVLALLLFAPTIQLFLFAFAVDYEVEQIATIVVDQDQTGASRRRLEDLLAEGTLRDVGRTDDPAVAEAALSRGEATVAVIIPPGFARQGGRQEPQPVQVLFDGSDPNQGTAAANAARGFFGDANSSPVATRILYNPGLDTSPYMVPALAGILLLLVTTTIAAMGLARESETGTLEQVLVTPISPGVLLVGKLLPFGVVGFFDFALALIVGVAFFGVPVQGSLLALSLVVVLYLVSTLSLGLLVSSLSTSQQQAFMTGFLVMLPVILLSGVLTPLRAMPEWLQIATWANPLRHFASLARALLLRGASLSEMLPELLALLLCAVVLLAASVLSFRKTKS